MNGHYTEYRPGVYVANITDERVEELCADVEAFQRTLAEIRALPEVGR